MAQSPSLSFGPAWMRPKPKGSPSSSSQPLQQVPQVPVNPISQTYTVDELLKIWNLININVSKSGLQFTEKFKSLEPIQNLVEQVEIDRQIQAQAQASQQQGQRVNQYQNLHSQQSLQHGKDQLNDKLNDITTNWTPEEQSALDIAGILKNVAAQSSISSSPALQSTALHASTSESLLQTHFIPEQPALIQPSELEWQYLDPNGNQQGPFSGANMQQWYIGGYLRDDLQLHRVGEAGFYTLLQLKTLLGSNDPFSMPLPPVAFQQPISQSSFQFNQGLSSNSLSNVFDTSFHQPSPTAFSQQPQSQQGFFGGISQVRAASPWSSSPQVPTQSLLQQNSVPSTSASPFLLGINLHDNSGLLNNNVIASTNNYTSSFDFGSDGLDQGLLDEIQSVALNDMLNVAEPTLVKEEEPVKVPEIKQPAEGIKETLQAVQPVQPVQQKPQQIPQKNEPKQEKKSIAKPQSSKPVIKTTESSSKPVKSQETPIAPWASLTQTKTSATNEPRLTMSQIHELEKIEAARQLKLEEEKQKKSIRSRLISEQNGSGSNISSPIKAKNDVDIPLTWALNNVTVPVKSIFEIQKEEEELAKLKEQETKNKEAKEMAAAIAIVEANERKSSFAAQAANADSNDNSWTTVIAKKPAKQFANKPKITSTTSRISPDVLRKVSAPPTTATATSSISKPSPSKPIVSKINTRYEFLDWCKSTLRLNKNVNVDEVLSVLLILPTGSNESKEIIADTIYCNSSTMDGRRFANDFMKRRETVDSIVGGDGLQWDDVLVSFNRNDGLLPDEDDGDFQVVRKGKRRN